MTPSRQRAWHPLRPVDSAGRPLADLAAAGLAVGYAEGTGIVAVRVSAVDVRVLLLDPDSPAAAIRAAEIGESPDSFGTGIRLTLDRAHLAAVIGGLPVGWLVVPCGALLSRAG